MSAWEWIGVGIAMGLACLPVWVNLLDFRESRFLSVSRPKPSTPSHSTSRHGSRRGWITA